MEPQVEIQGPWGPMVEFSVPVHGSGHPSDLSPLPRPRTRRTRLGWPSVEPGICRWRAAVLSAISTRSAISTSVYAAAVFGGLVALTFATPGWAAFPLVARGQAASILVDAAESTEPDLALAIEDFRHLIAESAGCEAPPLLRVGAPRPRGPVVVIGGAAALPVTETELGYDGYVIRVEDKRIVLAGPSPAGSANAIYDFLETEVGVRFVAPGEDGVVVPRQREIAIRTGERRERPAFALRQAWYNENVLARASQEERASLRRFARRHRAGGIPSIIGHYFTELVPPSVHFSEHPEYFAEVNGQRVADGQLCTSHPYVTQLAAEHWIDRFRREPELRVGSLSPNDGGSYCSCSICRNFGADLTARLIHFMNDVTRRVNSVHPNRYLAFYAYGQIADPPYQRGTRLQTNLIPVVARYGVCQVHPITDPRCPSNTRFRSRLKGWTEIAHQIMARDYAWWWPVPDLTLTVMRDNLRTYQTLGAMGISREYLHRGFLSDIVMLTDLKLQWNPEANADSLLYEALEARFGAAAPGMRAAYDELRAISASVPPGTVITGDTRSATELYKASSLRLVVERLDRLAGQAEGPARARVGGEADLLRAALLHLEALEATDRYKLTGRADDRNTARERTAEAHRHAQRLEPRRTMGANAVDELAKLEAQLLSTGLGKPFSGAFDYEDDMARGGFSRRDASRLDGFHPGSYGLSLLPGKIGRVAYTFVADRGERFVRAELHDLVMHGSESRIEVTVKGVVHQIAEGLSHENREMVYDLTPTVRGATEFTIIFWARNATQKSTLALDHWGVRGEVR